MQPQQVVQSAGDGEGGDDRGWRDDNKEKKNRCYIHGGGSHDEQKNRAFERQFCRKCLARMMTFAEKQKDLTKLSYGG